jgi:nucleoside-diphosphate-sugar epimerase
MALAFISAANTVLGLNLAAYLRAEGWTVAAQIRPDQDEAPLQALGVEVFAADLSLRWVPLDILPRDVDVIFNLFDLDVRQPIDEKALEEQLVHSTHGLLVAAADTNCRVFVHQSPAHVYQPINGTPFTETVAADAQARGSIQIKLAQQAERRVRHSGQRGLETLIVNTALDLGPGSELGWMGLIGLLESGQIPRAPRGSVTIGDPVAMAPAMVRAAKYGHNGDHFLLGGECVPAADLIGFIAARLGLPEPASGAVSALRDGLLTRLRRPFGTQSTLLARDLLTLLDADCRFDDTHARTVLGYAPRDAETVIASATDWWLSGSSLTDAQ